MPIQVPLLSILKMPSVPLRHLDHSVAIIYGVRRYRIVSEAWEYEYSVYIK